MKNDKMKKEEKIKIKQILPERSGINHSKNFQSPLIHIPKFLRVTIVGLFLLFSIIISLFFYSKSLKVPDINAIGHKNQVMTRMNTAYAQTLLPVKRNGHTIPSHSIVDCEVIDPETGNVDCDSSVKYGANLGFSNNPEDFAKTLFAYKKNLQINGWNPSTENTSNYDNQGWNTLHLFLAYTKIINSVSCNITIDWSAGTLNNTSLKCYYEGFLAQKDLPYYG